MSRFTKALRSSIGAKLTMAVTGVLLLGFVVAHMLGNLQVFAGRERLNAYAHSLQALGALLWAMRAGLLAVFVLHVATAYRLWSENRAARGPRRYEAVTPDASTYASRTMMLSGVVVALFVVYHLLHFTFGVVQPSHFHLPDASSTEPRYDVYTMTILGFRHEAVALSYVVAQVFLGLHISHGASSLFHTLGFTNPRMETVNRRAGPLLAGLVVAGNVAIPVAVYLRLVGSDVR